MRWLDFLFPIALCWSCDITKVWITLLLRIERKLQPGPWPRDSIGRGIGFGKSSRKVTAWRKKAAGSRIQLNVPHPRHQNRDRAAERSHGRLHPYYRSFGTLSGPR